MISEKAKKRFKEKYFVNENGCWQWTGAVGGSSRPSPQIRIDWKLYYASRISYEMHIGSITEGLYVCHHCDNHLCVNPQHLFLGTQRDNMRDASRKGRLSGKAVMNESIVSEIKRLRAEGKTHAEISKILSIPIGTVGAILIGNRWA